MSNQFDFNNFLKNIDIQNDIKKILENNIKCNSWEQSYWKQSDGTTSLKFNSNAGNELNDFISDLLKLAYDKEKEVLRIPKQIIIKDIKDKIKNEIILTRKSFIASKNCNKRFSCQYLSNEQRWKF